MNNYLSDDDLAALLVVGMDVDVRVINTRLMVGNSTATFRGVLREKLDPSKNKPYKVMTEIGLVYASIDQLNLPKTDNNIEILFAELEKQREVLQEALITIYQPVNAV